MLKTLFAFYVKNTGAYQPKVCLRIIEKDTAHNLLKLLLNCVNNYDVLAETFFKYMNLAKTAAKHLVIDDLLDDLQLCLQRETFNFFCRREN